MEFQTNKGTLMQSSGSANIITQLGYLQNYAGKGHFLTRERVGGTGGFGSARRARANRGARCDTPPPRPPRGGLGTARAFSLFIFPFCPVPPPRPHARRAAAAPHVFPIANFEEAPPGFTDGEAGTRLLGLFIIILGWLFFFLCTAGAHVPGRAGDARLRAAEQRQPPAQRSGAGSGHRAPVPADRERRGPRGRGGGRAGLRRGGPAGLPPFNLCRALPRR